MQPRKALNVAIQEGQWWTDPEGNPVWCKPFPYVTDETLPIERDGVVTYCPCIICQVRARKNAD